MAALFDCAVLCRAATPAVSMWIPVCCCGLRRERRSARPPPAGRMLESPCVCKVELFTANGSQSRPLKFKNRLVHHGIADTHPPSLADAPPAWIALGDDSELAALAA